MPKVKTHKGARKRFKVSASGKVLHAKAGRRHLLTGKPSKRMRRVRKPGQIEGQEAKNIKRLLSA